MSNGLSVKCMLDSGATHSFVHLRIVQSTEVQPSEGTVLTVTVASGSKVLHNDVRELDLMFTAEGGDRHVTVSLQLCTLAKYNGCRTWLACCCVPGPVGPEQCTHA